MHKILQFTFVLLLSSTFLANIGLNQSDVIDPNNIDIEKQKKQLKKFINSQDEETGNRILSLQIATLESISMLSRYEKEDETSLLMNGELHTIRSAINNLKSSDNLDFELSYLEENLKLIQSELSVIPTDPVNVTNIDCTEVTRSMMKNNLLTLFDDPLAKSGKIKANINIKPSIEETLFDINIQVSNTNARDFLGGLEQNTLLIFESASGNTIKCPSKLRSYGVWKDETMSIDYNSTFVLPSNCQYFDSIHKVKLIWTNGLHEYNITDKKNINDFLACQCQNYK